MSEAVLIFSAVDLEAGARIDAPGGAQHVAGPQHDPGVAGPAGEPQAFIDEPGATPAPRAEASTSRSRSWAAAVSSVAVQNTQPTR
ncbi:MAG: hypothetical protein QOE41_1810 [Mycobacterium sp.]|jgi:hypothetical protein|nr:hypothetical protein [Mycobacterium sp.]